ncbi:MAG: hypothetical protein Q7R94_01090 [bacterium]|nr:hypothetical protein [bacterium]
MKLLLKRSSYSVIFIVLSFFLFFGAKSASAATNINSTTTEHWAWNDLIGWINFYSTNNINVGLQNLTGYASSSAGDISLDCHTTRNGDICSSSNYQVTNDGSGNLSNWGWNDQYGWISFDCSNNDGCGASPYRVYIDESNGQFRNYAWNELIGWFSFNCLDPNICGDSDYKVVTSWVPTSTVGTLDSATYDTGVNAGAQLNSVLWLGTQPAGTFVRFQFATANASSGPWNFKGTDGTSNTYFTTNPDISLNLDYSLFSNFRYFRYRVQLESNQAQTLSPSVEDIIVNWSP